MQTPKAVTAVKMKNVFLGLLLGAAALVVILRFFTYADLGYDLTIQIQAAQHLLAGKGLKVFISSESEIGIGEPLKLLTLTHFPCGYSLYCAAALGMGLPLALATKVFGVLCTSLGWWGWGRFLLACLGNALATGKLWVWFSFILAVACPLFFTPAWNGTDIFLWATLPWVLQWLTTAANITGPRQFMLYTLVGLFCGTCVLMRYASIVLAGYAGLVILAQTGFRLSILARSWLVFGAGLIPALALQACVIHSSSEAHSTPGGIDSGRDAASVIHGLINGAKLLPTTNYVLLSWVPDRMLRLLMQPGTHAPWLYALTLAIFSLPFLVARKTGAGSFAAASRDLKVVAAGFVIATPLFLWACMAMGDFPYLAERRYYEPLILVVVSLIFYLAAPGHSKLTKTSRLTRFGFMIYVTCFAGMMLVGMVFLFIPTAHGAVQRKKMMGEADLRTFPKIGLSYSSSAMRRYVVQRLKTERDLELLTNFESWFYADPSVDQARVHRILRCDYLRGQSVHGPVRFLIVASDQGDDPHSIYYANWDGKFLRASCLETLPDLRLVATFPSEKVKVLESFVPAGTEVTFDANPLQESKL